MSKGLCGNDIIITEEFLKEKYPSMLKFIVAGRRYGKTIMITQHNMSVLYTKEIIKILKSGEELTELDYIEGLKSIYTEVGKLFCGDNDDK